MSNRRHHLHVICAANDKSLLLDHVAIFFQCRAFLTYDVSSELSQAALYGRQCIEDCDYTMLFIGDSYGATQNTGVSQMHLSYLSAKAKLKPMLIFIKTYRENDELSAQLKDFIRMVERQNIGIHYYANHLDIERLLTFAYEDMIVRHPALNWVRETISNGKILPSNIKPATNRSIPETGVKRHDVSAEQSDGIDNITKTIRLTDTFEFHYSVQAYEGGNLSDVAMSIRFTWQEILQALIKISSTFSAYGLQNCISRLVIARAEQDLKRQMPNVHAVARCQISQDDMIQLQQLLVAANWIQLAAVGARASQELWKLTFYAKKIYEDSQSILTTPL